MGEIRIRSGAEGSGYGSVADPTQLPNATGQVMPSIGTYTALPYYNYAGVQQGTNPRNMGVGHYYLDPTTNIKVVRLTDPNSPVSGGWLWTVAPDYSSGGPKIGKALNNVYPIAVEATDDGDVSTEYHIIAFDLSNYSVSYRSTMPGGGRGLQRAFSYVDANILYTLDTSGYTLRKWNVSGGTPSEISDGTFPKSFSAIGTDGYWTWLQVSIDDDWFSFRAGITGARLVMWQKSTNTTYYRDITGFDEHKMDKDGRYCLITNSENTWDSVTDTLRDFNPAVGDYLGHSDACRGYGFGCDGLGSSGQMWCVDLKSGSPSQLKFGSDLQNLYTNGSWKQNIATRAQWVCYAHQTGGSDFSQFLLKVGALGVVKLDGSSTKLLCHSFGAGNVNGYPDYETNSVWPNFSHDGRFLLFKSNQGIDGGFASAFAAILPVS